jgi:hypothetical protein
MKETKERIVVFGYSNQRFDIPKSHIIAVGRNVILDINSPDIFKYESDRNAPLPPGKLASELNDDARYISPSKLVDQTLHKQLITKDRKHLGYVDGFDNTNIIVKNCLFNPHYYKIPRAKVNSYQNKVLLNITEQYIIEHFGIKYPGYFNNISG